MKVLRTPDERFENLAGFRFEPHYLEIDDGVGGRLRMHYVDEGPRDGPLVLCLHGQPVWSYSFRKMVPLLAEAGHRVIAPDLVGFGRSDKPAERSDYTYARHVHWMQEFILSLDLTEITFVIHDWGGLIGLRVLTQNLERFDRVVACNMALHDAKDVPMERAPAVGRKNAAAAGLACLLDCFARFARFTLETRGTPAPVQQTEALVASGLYRFEEIAVIR